MESTFANLRGPVKSEPCLIISSTSKPTRMSASDTSSGVTFAGISTNSLIQDKGARIRALLQTVE